MLKAPLVVELRCRRRGGQFEGKVCRLKRIDQQTDLLAGRLGRTFWSGLCAREFGKPECPDGEPYEPPEPDPVPF